MGLWHGMLATNSSCDGQLLVLGLIRVLSGKASASARLATGTGAGHMDD